MRHLGGVRTAAFTFNNERVVTGSKDATARVWHVRTGQPATDPLKHDGPVTSVQFSPDGRWVLSASQDGRARLWDAQTGQPSAHVFRHDAGVNIAQFSPTGRWVATASDDHSGRVWDVQTGQPVTPPLLHQQKVFFVQFTPDGQRLVSASHDGTARLWDAPQFTLLIPDWLPDLAEAVIGHRLNEEGSLEVVPVRKLLELKRRFESDPSAHAYNRWARWFFADRSTRTISPESPVTVTAYVESKAQ